MTYLLHNPLHAMIIGRGVDAGLEARPLMGASRRHPLIAIIHRLGFVFDGSTLFIRVFSHDGVGGGRVMNSKSWAAFRLGARKQTRQYEARNPEYTRARRRKRRRQRRASKEIS